MQRLLDIENLRTTFDIHVGKVQAVRGVNLHVDEGETVGVVGESGCGKSVSMLSVLHLLPDYAKISADKMIFDGTDLTRLTPKMFRKISGDQIGMIFQDPAASFCPVRTIGDQLHETLNAQHPCSRAESDAAAAALFTQLGLAAPEKILTSYPFALSGGMSQRVALAIAMLLNPARLLADEPTSALDPELVGEVLETIREIAKAGNTMLIVSHEMNFVKNVATKVIFMEGGKIVEMGTPQQIFGNPKNERTRDFLIKNSIVIPPEFSI